MLKKKKISFLNLLITLIILLIIDGMFLYMNILSILVIYLIVFSWGILFVVSVFNFFRQDKKLTILTSLAAFFIITIYIWEAIPFKFRYYCAKSELNRIAEKFENGEKIQTPIKAGTFTILKIETEHTFEGKEITCLWTYVHPHGNNGFVKTPKHYIPFNLWWDIKLDNEWQYIEED